MTSRVSVSLFNVMLVGSFLDGSPGSDGWFTVTLQVAVRPFDVLAVMVATPFAIAVTFPLPVTAATLALFVDQDTLRSSAVAGATVAVRVSVPLTSRVSVSLFNVMLVGTFVDGSPGSDGLFTVTLQVAVTPFLVLAVIVATPFAIAVTFPFDDTVATSFLLLDHATSLFSSSADVTVAVKVLDSFTSKVISSSLNWMDVLSTSGALLSFTWTITQLNTLLFLADSALI